MRNIKVQHLIILFILVLISCKKETTPPDYSSLIAVTTGQATDIEYTTASVTGTLSDPKGNEITNYGHCWATSSNPTISSDRTQKGKTLSAKSFTSELSGLAPGTQYYVRSYFEVNGSVGYSDNISFSTVTLGTPVVQTNEITDISTNSAICGGNITDDGGSEITARGVCWSTTGDPTTSDNKTSDGSGNGIFSSNLTNLSPGIEYYVRAYAITDEGTTYASDQEIFTTLSGVIELSTSPITDVTSNSAKSGGSITNDGGLSITSRGLCWNLTGNPIVSDNTTNEGTGIVSFSSNLTDLPRDTEIHVRAYATNNVDTYYGNEQIFTTRDGIPVVSTISVSDITTISAISGGNITDDGGSTVTARGVCWNTTGSPTLSNDYTNDGSGTGSFTSSISDLMGETDYYLRAYATNEYGTEYGNEVFFSNKTTGTIIDIEGNEYNTVRIGDQWWMAENLKTIQYNDESIIPKVTDNTTWSSLTTPAYCWYDNDEETYKNVYGALYNWYVVETGKLCPSGWHVPTRDEWNQLEMHLGMSYNEAISTNWEGDIAGKLKETGTTHWNNTTIDVTNESGFTALPGGQRSFDNGVLSGEGGICEIWNQTEYQSNYAYFVQIVDDLLDIYHAPMPKGQGSSVRCIKDE